MIRNVNFWFFWFNRILIDWILISIFIIDIDDVLKIFKIFRNFKWTTGSETSPRCSLGNGFLGLANIWSRLLKHNWWDPLYGKVRIHSDVFFGFTFNENSFLYGYINRASSEFQPMHVYDQQLWLLFHRCGSSPLFLNSWR